MKIIACRLYIIRFDSISVSMPRVNCKNNLFLLTSCMFSKGLLHLLLFETHFITHSFFFFFIFNLRVLTKKVKTRLKTLHRFPCIHKPMSFHGL